MSVPSCVHNAGFSAVAVNDSAAQLVHVSVCVSVLEGGVCQRLLTVCDQSALRLAC